MKDVSVKRKKRDKKKVCPVCGGKLNYLGYGEGYCRGCDKYYKNGREIVYTLDGFVRFYSRSKCEQGATKAVQRRKKSP